MSVIETVRHATSTAHVRLERRLASPQSWSRERYRDYLGRLWGAVHSVESATTLESALARLVPDLAERSCKGDQLARDLAELGVDAATLPLMPLPATSDAVEQLGLLYVMEGSTLGGVVLAKQLEASLGALPTRYLRCYGPDTASKWRTFMTTLERHEADRDRIARSATTMFEHVEAWFESGGLLGPDSSPEPGL